MIPGAEEGVAVVLLGIDRLEGAQRTAQALECTLIFLSKYLRRRYAQSLVMACNCSSEPEYIPFILPLALVGGKQQQHIQDHNGRSVE